MGQRPEASSCHHYASAAHRQQCGNVFGQELKFVSEPKCLETYRSLDYEPSNYDFAAGHAIAPCAPSHRRHLRRVKRQLKTLLDAPERLKDFVTARRRKLERIRHRQDQVVVLEVDHEHGRSSVESVPDSANMFPQVVLPEADT